MGAACGPCPVNALHASGRSILARHQKRQSYWCTKPRISAPRPLVLLRSSALVQFLVTAVGRLDSQLDRTNARLQQLERAEGAAASGRLLAAPAEAGAAAAAARGRDSSSSSTLSDMIEEAAYLEEDGDGDADMAEAGDEGAGAAARAGVFAGLSPAQVAAKLVERLNEQPQCRTLFEVNPYPQHCASCPYPAVLWAGLPVAAGWPLPPGPACVWRRATSLGQASLCHHFPPVNLWQGSTQCWLPAVGSGLLWVCATLLRAPLQSCLMRAGCRSLRSS
jgi:hypothetical protein